MSLETTLGEMPTGAPISLTPDDVALYIRQNYFTHREFERRNMARRRELFYQNNGDEFLLKDIQNYFEDARVRVNRAKFIEAAKYNNVSKRVVDEVSTVYSRPAQRSVADARSNGRYQAVAEFLQLDAVMRRVNRALNLHSQCLIIPRVRTIGTKAEPVLDIIVPNSAFGVAHPKDNGFAVGFGVEVRPRFFKAATQQVANIQRWILWDDETFRYLNADGDFIQDTRVVHGFPRMPIVYCSLEKHTDLIFEHTPNEDIVAGHRSVWLQNVLGLKESKSANKQTLVSGDLSQLITGQSGESDVDLIGPEGVQTQTIDRGVEVSQFRDNANYILETLAANRGIPPSVLRHEGATSGHEIELRRIGIREIRRSQEMVFRNIERELAKTMSMVFAQDLPELAFDIDGWSIDFGEIETPLSDEERLRVFETERRLNLTNTLKFMRERDPDLRDDKAAMTQLIHNIQVETERNFELRVLQAISGSPDQNMPDESAVTPTDGGNDPELTQ